MKNFLIILISTFAFGQQDSQYTQYMYNTIAVNPAYAGKSGVLTILALHREQWIGLDGAPSTSTVAVNAPLKGEYLGFGVTAVSDKIGPTTLNDVSADLAYSIKTSDDFRLAFGIKASLNLFKIDVDKLDIRNDRDLNFQDINGKLTPNIGAGIYYHSDKAYIGFSTPSLIEQKSISKDEIAVYKKKINYYLIGGYVFDLNSALKFKPAVLTKVVQGAPLQVDLSTAFMIDQKVTLGVGYRWSAALSAMAGFQLSKSVFLGYGYDGETTKVQRYNKGSHEIFIRLEILNQYYRNACSCQTFF